MSARDAIDELLDKAAGIAQSLMDELGMPGAAALLPSAEPEKSPEPPPAAEPPAEESVNRDAPQPDPPATGSEPASDTAAAAACDPTAAEAESSPEAGMPNDKPIDDQLAEVEGLLDETRAQLGESPADAAADETPDDSAKPDSAPTPDKPVAESEAAADAPPVERGPGIDVDLESEGVPSFGGGGMAEGASQRKERPVQAIPPTPWNRTLVFASNLLCATLDRCDRPFDRINYPMRQAFGLLAIATLLAAIATLILSNM